MTYLIGAAVGVAIGCAVGFLKDLLLWKKYVQSEVSKAAAQSEAKRVYPRLMLSNGINIACIVIIFVVREYLPFSWGACLIGAATALVITNIVISSKRKVNQ